MSNCDFITSAQKYCLNNGLRLTAPRLYVLSILGNENEPMGAYDVLKKLSLYIKTPKPPTVYRALDFWQKHGFVHKIESLNAFITRHENYQDKDTHFLVCDGCNSVQELHDIRDTNHHKNIPTEFVAKRTFTETHGICGECT